MSVARQSCRYRCLDDCEPAGCPGHEATLELQSVSDSYRFDDGKGSVMFMHEPEIKAFLSMLRALQPDLLQATVESENK